MQGNNFTHSLCTISGETHFEFIYGKTHFELIPSHGQSHRKKLSLVEYTPLFEKGIKKTQNRFMDTTGQFDRLLSPFNITQSNY